MQLFLIISLSFITSISLSSQDVQAGQVCCEKTKEPNVRYCDYVDENECAPGSQSVPTSCEQTSFCKTGCCAGIGGYCYDNYPKALCEQQYNGRYTGGDCSATNECKKGCCVIGTEASYTTKNKCISETQKYSDLEVDFRENINSEQECIEVARSSEKGCCVTPNADTGNSCRYTAKSECTTPGSETVNNSVGFKTGKFCSQLPNLCSCAPGDPSINLGNIKGEGNAKSTMCISGDDSVYWKDSCGNPEGLKEKCDYAAGNICGDTDLDGKSTCEKVDCKGQGINEKLLSADQNDINGKISKEVVGKDIVKNGESWCLWDYPTNDVRDKYYGKDPVGARHYRSLCINGKELVEPCADFRKEYCFSSDIPLEGTKQNLEFLAARCLKNDRIETCVNECNTADPVKMPQQEYAKALETDYQCCTDLSKRDCQWAGKCVPAVKPGYKFWEAEGIDQCGKASLECKATFVCAGWDSKLGICNTEGGDTGWRWAKRIGITGIAAAIGAIVSGGLGAVGAAVAVGGMLTATEAGASGWTLASGGECFSKDFVQAGNNYCRSLGDCGADINYQGKLSVDGYGITSNIESEDVKSKLPELELALNDMGSKKIVERIKKIRDKLDVPFSDQDKENLKKRIRIHR